MPLKPVGTRVYGADSHDALTIEELTPNLLEVWYEPSQEKLELASQVLAEPPTVTRKRLLEVGFLGGHFLAMYPLNTIPTYADFLGRKYKRIESICLDRWDYDLPETSEDVLEQLQSLPSGFVKDPSYGLGLLKEYRCIIEAIETIPEVKHVMISWQKPTAIDEDFYYLNFSRFDELRRGINRISSQRQADAKRDRSIFAHNELLTAIAPARFPEAKRPYTPDTIVKLIGSTSSSQVISRADRTAAIKVIERGKRKMAEDAPEELYRLRNELELVSLEVLITKFEEMMTKSLSESRWQDLLNDNSFILNLAFGYPVFKIQDQAHVGGQTIRGAGATITDFLVKNGISNNVALFEIKTPQSPLLAKTEYRNGLFSPSQELVGAVSQILDQKYELQKSIAMIKENTRIYDLETFAVHGILIIGKMPTEINQTKSFELFRGNSKDVSVFTFDELLSKLKLLFAFLASSSPAAERAAKLTDLEKRVLRLQQDLLNCFETTSSSENGFTTETSTLKRGVDGRLVIELVGRCGILKDGFDRVRLDQPPFVLGANGNQPVIAKTVEEFIEQAQATVLGLEVGSLRALGQASDQAAI